MDSNRQQVLRALPASHQTIQAFYSFLVQRYLPMRYPQIFEIVREASARDSYLRNRVMDNQVPLESSADAASLLEGLGGQIEEDILILQPDEASGEFILGAYVGCFPNGFDWADKLGKTMSQIHVPVPDYETKLRKSMNRYLSRMEPGQSVKRHNVSVLWSGKVKQPR